MRWRIPKKTRKMNDPFERAQMAIMRNGKEAIQNLYRCKGLEDSEDSADVSEVAKHRLSQELTQPLAEKEIINASIMDKERFKILTTSGTYRLWAKPSTDEGGNGKRKMRTKRPIRTKRGNTG